MNHIDSDHESFVYNVVAPVCVALALTTFLTFGILWAASCDPSVSHIGSAGGYSVSIKEVQ